MADSARDIIAAWPEASREAAQLVIDRYGEPHEATGSQLTWQGIGPWKRMVATREYWEHRFPTPHTDSVESFIDYQVPPEKFTDLARFDGSVIVERTTGEVSARCHDEEANLLALNLMHDIVTGERDVEGARAHYAQEFLDHRRGEPTPYMEGLRFRPADGDAADPDSPVLSDEDLRQASEAGRAKQHG